MRRPRRKQTRKLYAAGYLRSPSQASGFKRHTVLAVCNVVGAAGLIGLISYSFFSERVERVAKADAGVIEVRVERTRAVDEPPVGGAALAGLGPQLTRPDGGKSNAAAPLLTGAILADSGPRRVSTPSDAVVLRASLSDDMGGTGAVAVSRDIRRVVIGGGAVSIPQSEPIRLASIGSIADVMPTSSDTTTDADDLSFGSLFRDREPDRSYAATPRPAPVPLVRRDNRTEVLTLSFVRPPSYVPDIGAESRIDLMKAEEVARQAIEEADPARDRRIARERYCLAAAVYYEARGEPESGQEAVAQVIINRVEDERYPNTICGVVFQDEDRRHRCQFSFACDGKPERPKPGLAWTRALNISEEFLNGHTYAPAIAATHYHADYVRPRWSRASGMTRVHKVGHHIFYSDS